MSDRNISDRQSIWTTLTDFSYNPSHPASWVKLGCQVCVAGMLIALLKALDGEVCGRGWRWDIPQTWSNPVGCFVRSLVRNVPDSFGQPTGGTAPGNSTLVQPPQP